MADKLTIKQRSLLMSKIRSKNTRTEKIVRSRVFKFGFRYRLNNNCLFGKPDIVIAKQKIVIFVHGCFWHRHTCKRGRSLPKSNVAFWMSKFENNKRRDRIVKETLRKDGWDVLVIWECWTKNEEKLAAKLNQLLGQRSD
jgi:DNA mismatch endonuclease (patch repair protein)